MTDFSFPQDTNDHQRGLAEDAEPRFLMVGEVLKPHGVRGEVRVRPVTDVPERFGWLKTIYVGQEKPRPVAVVSARLHQDYVLLKLEGIDDRDAAESLRGAWLQVAEADAIPLEEDEYFLYQLEGLAVLTVSGEELGHITDIIETKANNVFVVQGSRGEILVPDIEDVVREIDLENGRVVIQPMPGLLPD